MGLEAGRFERVDVGDRGFGEGDGVQTLEQTPSVGDADAEAVVPLRRDDAHLDEVDRQAVGLRIRFDGTNERRDGVGLEYRREQSVGDAVLAEDGTEAWCHDDLDAELRQGPDGMLAG